MTEINIPIGVGIDGGSIRELQSGITKAVENLTPKLSLQLTENNFAKIRNDLQTKGLTGLTISEIEFSPSTLNDIRRVLNEGLSVAITEVPIKSFNYNAALTKLRADIDKTLTDYQIAIALDDRRGGGGSKATQAIPQDLQEAATKSGLSTRGDAVTEQRIQVERELRTLRGKEAVLVAQGIKVLTNDVAEITQLTDIHKKNKSVQELNLTASKKNFNAITEITKISSEFNSGLISANEALKQYGKLKIVQPNVQTGQEGQLSSQANERLKAAVSAASSAKKASDALAVNTKAEEQLTKVTRDLQQGRKNQISLLNRAQDVKVETGQGSGQFGADVVAQQDLLVGRLQSRLNAEAQAEQSSLKFAEASKFAAEGIRSGEADQKGARKRATEAARALARLTKIQEQAGNEGLTYKRALEQASKLVVSGSAGGTQGASEASRAIIAQFNKKQLEVIAELEGRVGIEDAAKASTARLAASQKNMAAQAKISSDRFKYIASEANKNGDGLKKLRAIESQLDNDLIKLSDAARQASKIESIGNAAKAGSLVNELNALRDALLQRIENEQRGNAVAEKALLQQDLAEAAQKEANKQLQKSNSEAAKRLGISLKTTTASESILSALEGEAVTIVRGQKETKDALGFLAEKIRAGARKIFDIKPPKEPLRNSPSNAAGGSSVTFRNAGDIQKFSNQLNPKQLGEFVDKLNGLNSAAGGAEKSIGRTAQNQAQLVRELKRGQSAASDFGKQVQIAGKRLLAWAAPANLIFTTISRLRQATSEVVAIDREARRLVFFSNAGAIITKSSDAIREFAKNVTVSAEKAEGLRALATAFDANVVSIDELLKISNQLAVTNQAISKQFILITSVARTYGISLQSATEALVEITRVGQVTEGTFRGGVSAFTDAALSLSTVERAALSTSDAVRGLQAIQAQFFGGAGGDVFSQLADSGQRAAAAAINVSNAAAVLEATAAGSSASVSELIDATTRLGSAFTNLAGLNFDQTVAILGQAFTATGATTGRLATALRQTATLISQNAVAIQELTGGELEVVDADGTVKGFEAILDVLERIRNSAGTLAATELSLLIADRRNVADIQALAQNVDSLRDAFDRFGDPVERINRVVEAQLKLYDQVGVAQSSLEAKTENLNTAFAELASSEGLRIFGGDILNTITGLVQGFNGLLGAIGFLSSAFGPLVAAIGGLFAARILTGVGSFVRGLLQSNTALKKQSAVLKGVTSELTKQKNIGSNIRALGDAGLLTAEEEERAQKAIVAELAQQSSIKSQIKANEKLIAIERNKSNVSESKINRLLSEQRGLLDQIASSSKRVQGVTEATARAAERNAKATRDARNQRAVQAGLLAAGAAATAAQASGNEFAGGVLQDAVAGGAAGSAAGPWGALAGAIAGATTGGIVRGTREGLKEVERENARVVDGTATSVGAVVAAINSAQGGIKKTAKLADAEAIRGLDGQSKRLKNLKRDIEALGGLQSLINRENLGRLDDEEKKKLVGIRAAAGAELALQAGAIKATKDRENSNRNEQLAIRLIGERKKLEEDILSGRLSAKEIVEATSKIERNTVRLKRDELAILTPTKQAEIELLEAAQQRLIVSRRIKAEFQQINNELKLQQVLSDAISLSGLGGSSSELELKIELDEGTFNRAIAAAEDGIKRLEQARRDGGDKKEIAKQIKDEEQKITDTRVKRLSALIKQQKTILTSANKAARAQISAWEKASKNVSKAFSNVVSKQKGLAAIFKTIGEATSEIITRTSENVSSVLESSGARIGARLSELVESTSQQLSNTRRVFRAQQSTLGQRFSSGAGIAASVKTLIEASANVISKSDEKILEERRKYTTTEGARSRELSRAARSQFDLRIKETRREIEVRKNLLNEEIKILRRRDSEERKLNSLRRTQQEDFGRLLIESPQKFQETLDNIATATNFFRGITEINESSLRTLQQRSENLRNSGEGGQDALRKVLSGVEAKVSTGGSDIVSGIGNRKLQQILSRVQIENIGEIADDLIRQDDEARSQTRLQREIDARQRALVGLAEFDATVQRNLLELAQSDAKLAVAQRDRQFKILTNIKDASENAAKEFRLGLKAVIGVLTLSIDPSKLDRQNSKFVDKLAGVLGKLAPTRGGTTLGGIDSAEQLKKAAEDVKRSFNSFLGRDFAATKTNKVEREKLNTVIEAERKNLEKSISAISKFTSSLGNSTTVVDANIEATKRQRGVGLKNVGGGAVQERIGDLRGGLTKQKTNISGFSRALGVEGFSGRNKFVSDEIREIKERTKTGGQLTRVEKNRLAELEKLGRRGFANNATGGRQIARRLFRDDSFQRNTVGRFRQTLGDDPTNQNDFIDRARRLRGEGSRGRRNIDVEQTQRFLTGAGFTGAARSISTRGQAANVLDRFIEISERLAKEQDKISAETKKKIIQVLGEELVTGIKEVTNKTADAALLSQAESDKRKKAAEEKRADNIISALDRAAKKRFNGSIMSDETGETLKQAFVDGGKGAAEKMNETLIAGAQRFSETMIQVDDIKLKADITGQINYKIDESLGASLRAALLPVMGDTEELRAVVDNLKQALLKANFPGVKVLPPNNPN